MSIWVVPPPRIRLMGNQGTDDGDDYDDGDEYDGDSDDVVDDDDGDDDAATPRRNGQQHWAEDPPTPTPTTTRPHTYTCSKGGPRAVVTTGVVRVKPEAA